MEAMDKALGIRTGMGSAALPLVAYFNRYEPTPYPVLARLAEILPLGAADTVVDYGCGKGRVLFYLVDRFGCRGVGVEVVHATWRAAQENLAGFAGPRDRLRFLLGPAEGYPVAAADNFFFFFNPFSAEIFMRTVAAIEGSLAASPRPAALVLYYPDPDWSFYLENFSVFQLAGNFPVDGGRPDDPRERLLVYRFQPE